MAQLHQVLKNCNIQAISCVIHWIRWLKTLVSKRSSVEVLQWSQIYAIDNSRMFQIMVPLYAPVPVLTNPTGNSNLPDAGITFKQFTLRIQVHIISYL